MTITTVKLRKTIIGNGQPKIAIPITGNSQEMILKQANKIAEVKPDLIEWRIDYYKDLQNVLAFKATTIKLRETIGDIPLLITFRTQKEGGQMSIENKDYFSIYQQIIIQNLTDALDIELFLPRKMTEPLLTKAQKAGITVIISNHDFKKTPTKNEIVDRLIRMANLGADIAKIAVTPKSTQDVETLLDATLDAHQQLTIPLITMSMGSLGKISRISGEIFGSALTFGTVGNASAPGQIKINELRKYLSGLAL